MKKLNSAGLVAAVCALGFGLAGVAGAQTADAPQLAVRYSASSLATEGGVHHLYSRLVSAAETVCPQVGRVANSAVVACRKQAVADAVAQIHNPRLAALSAGYTKNG